jgi:diguanylate cyclase (GGDEF)-like protein
VTRRHASEALIREMAFQDVLTDLAHLRLFMDRLQQALLSMERTGPCAVLMFLDLNRFKLLNDQRGHAAGDVLLQQVAQRLTACVRGIDTVVRLGGDEFALLMEDVDTDEQRALTHARTVADKVKQALAIEFDLGDESQHNPTPAASA